MCWMWTKEHRARQLAFERGRRYPTDLTDGEWERVKPLLPKPPRRGRKPGVDLREMPPVEALERLVRFTFNYYVRHPEFVASLSNENLMQARFLRQSVATPAVNRPIIAVLADILRRGTEAGLFRSDLDPVDFYISISALGFMYMSNRHTLGVAFGRDLMEADQLQFRLAAITDIILRAAAVLPGTRRPE